MNRPDFSRLGPPPGARLVVVGGCGGIGRAVVAAGLETGLETVVMDLPDSAQKHPPPAGVSFVDLDGHHQASVAAAFKTLGRLWDRVDILVHLIGFTDHPGPIAEMAVTDWDEVLSGNLRSAFLVTQAALPLLRQSREGSIVYASSGLALKGSPGYGPYAAAKAGLIAMMKTVARECAPHIRANAVAPGAVDTEFLTGGVGRSPRPLRFDKAAYAEKLPLGRLAGAQDIVGPILFLAGPASRYMTGQVLYINGGGLMP